VSRPADATAAFNLGVALEDLGRLKEALAAYESAIALDPANADAHYNAASLCERLAQPANALRHLKDYRLLTRTPFT
jgi:tetratricopeptide (TPR) repeat protein